jgi:hypothetical protein
MGSDGAQGGSGDGDSLIEPCQVEPVPPSCEEAAHISQAPSGNAGDVSVSVDRSSGQVTVNIRDASKEKKFGRHAQN